MDLNKPVLAFDTSLNGCAVCVLHNGAVETRLFPTEREQAAKLVPLIQETMAAAGVKFADIGLIVTSMGPGSFTGLRIGLSTARAFGLALNIPVHGMNSMAVMAASCAEEGDSSDSFVLLETKRSDYYSQIYNAAGQAMNDPACVTADQALALYKAGQIVCGDAVQRFADEAKARGVTIDPSALRPRKLLEPVMLARLGMADFLAKDGQVDSPVPLYLRGADVSVSNKIQRMIEEMPL